MGRGRREGTKKIWGDDGYVHDLDCGDNFIDI